MTTMTTLTTTLTCMAQPEVVHMHLRMQDAGEGAELRLAEPVDQLRSQGALPITYRALITELGKILLKHRNEDDTLSCRLFAQGERFKVFVLEATEQPSDEVLLHHVEELRALLRNPFGSHLLIKPCMLWTSPDGVQPPCRFDLVWEESYLDAYCAALSYVSTHQTIKKPHAFAVDMLRWIHSLPIHGSHAYQAYQAQGMMVNRLGTTTLGVQGVTTVAVAQGSDPVPELPRNEKKARKMLAKYQILFKQVDQERLLWGKIGILQVVNQVLETQIAAGNAELEARFDTVDRQLTHIAEESQAGLLAVKSEYAGAIQVVREQLNRTENTLDQSRKELAQAKAEVSGLKAANSALAYQISHLAARVGWLENQVNDSDSCSLM